MRVPRPRVLVAAVLLAVAGITVPSVPAAAAPGFVTAAAGGFVLDGKPLRYGGTNNYYMIFGSQAMVDDVFADTKAMDLTVLRGWAALDIGSLDGSVKHVDGEGKKADVYFQYWDPVKGAESYGKPVVLEEFGITDQSRRDAVYQTWTSTVRTGSGDGWNFWILTGVGWDGTSLYPDYDGFRLYSPSATATMLAEEARLISGGAPPDTERPTRPGTPSASAITGAGARLSWTASTDDRGVTGYDVYREAGAMDVKAGTADTNSFTLTGLAAETAYTLFVVARDAAGNSSDPSGSVTFTTAVAPAGTCARTHRLVDSWQGGLQGEVAIKCTEPVNAWQGGLTWPSGSGVRLGNAWGATVTQTGDTWRFANAAWNGSVPAGGTATFGFTATWTGSGAPPTPIITP